jgi:carboxypeptidase Taq
MHLVNGDQSFKESIMAATVGPEETAALAFSRSDTRIAALLEHLHEIADLRALGALAQWDQNTAMAEGAGEVRGKQLATVQGVVHQRLLDSRLGALLTELEAAIRAAPFTDADRALVWHARRDFNYATKLPEALVRELAENESLSFEDWRKARAANDFARWAPRLGRTVELMREVADRLGHGGTRYDALVDLYEPGMTTAALNTLFATVRDVSLSLLRRIQASGTQVDDACLRATYPAEKQVALCDTVLHAIGYDFTRGGTARSPHPFTTSFGTPFDVRLTIRTDEHFLPTSVMAAIHEGGHALYEQGSAPTLVRTPVAGGASLGAHESQSRLWENAIGRTEPFWQGHFAAVRDAFPEQYANVDVATFARALNKVEPTLIRVEADEVTYNLHILIRFELEQALVNGELAVESLPGVWNAKYQEYLGITPPTDADGCMQDIHWTTGFGYFPTYTLGNLYGAQIYATLRRAFPDFDARLAQGDTAFVLGWLRDRMYVYGATYQPNDLIRRVTGEVPNPRYFAEYLTRKFADIYALSD